MTTQPTITSQTTLRATMSGAQEILEIAIAGTPADLANRPQPGRANPIGAIYAHAILSLDTFFHAGIQDSGLLLVSGGFAARLGSSNFDALNWPALQLVHWDVSTLQSYAQAVYDAVNCYLRTLDDAELGRACTIFGQATTVADTIALAVWHTALHAGEIAALKGASDLAGLPF